MKQLLIAAIVSVLLLAPGVASAEDQTVRLHFMGDDCCWEPFVVMGALERSDGVMLVEHGMENMWILVHFDDALISPSQMVETLNMFGYQMTIEMLPAAGA